MNSGARRGSSDSRRSSSDSRRHYSRESRHEEVEAVPNTPRVGGLDDMYRAVMQLLQQQSITQQQQNTTQAALLQLINPRPVDPTHPTLHVGRLPGCSSGTEWSPPATVRHWFFDPDVADEKGQGVIAEEGKSSTTIYKCVLAFTQRLEDVGGKSLGKGCQR
ncbi:hypothetical protein E4U58_000816 [Claviceps cyperi]|nr:hypothetical protein E4U58_000816 [Claviceps cyperi]